MTRWTSAASKLVIAGAIVPILSFPVTTSAQEDCEAERCAAEAAIAAQCACDAGTHGAYVSCVAGASQGLVSDECQGAVVRCAARSTCGKDGAVACLRPKFGPCDKSTGTCRKGPTVSCQSSRDCMTGAKCSIKRSAERCTAGGGMVSGSTSCCAACGPTTTTVATTSTTTVMVSTTTTTTAPGSPSGAFAD